MILGNKNKFAVEIEFPEPRNSWLYGHICYWIAGSQFGDYSSVTSLRDYLLQLVPALAFKGKRDSPQLWSMAEEKAFEYIDSSLYGGKAHDPVQGIDETTGRFDIQVPLDVFDDCKIYLVQNGNGEKIIYSNRPYAVVHNAVMERGTCEAVLMKVFEFLDSELTRLSK